MTFININKTNLNLLKTFYDKIYSTSFLNTDECETLDNLYYYINAEKINYDYHIILCYNNEDLIGGAILDYFYDTKTIVIEFIVIKQNCQQKGLGKELFNYIAGLYDYEQIVIEVNDPEQLSKDEPLNYLYFWNSLGFKKLDMTYIQPPLDKNKEPIYCLWLACKTKKNYIDKKTILSILADYFKYAMKIDDLVNCRQYLEIAAEINNKIKLNKLLEDK